MSWGVLRLRAPSPLKTTQIFEEVRLRAPWPLKKTQIVEEVSATFGTEGAKLFFSLQCVYTPNAQSFLSGNANMGNTSAESLTLPAGKRRLTGLSGRGMS